MSHVHAFSCVHTFNSLYFDILSYWCFSDCLAFFLSLFLALVCSMAPKQKSTSSQNPLHFGASSFSPSDPIPSHIRFHDEKAQLEFSKNFHDEAFIQNAKSFCQIFLTLTYPLSSIVGIRSHCVASRSRVVPWSYKSFTLICTKLTLLYLISFLMFEVCAS